MAAVASQIQLTNRNSSFRVMWITYSLTLETNLTLKFIEYDGYLKTCKERQIEACYNMTNNKEKRIYVYDIYYEEAIFCIVKDACDLQKILQNETHVNYNRRFIKLDTRE